MPAKKSQQTSKKSQQTSKKSQLTSKKQPTKPTHVPLDDYCEYDMWDELNRLYETCGKLGHTQIMLSVLQVKGKLAGLQLDKKILPANVTRSDGQITIEVLDYRDRAIVRPTDHGVPLIKGEKDE